MRRASAAALSSDAARPTSPCRSINTPCGHKVMAGKVLAAHNPGRMAAWLIERSPSKTLRTNREAKPQALCYGTTMGSVQQKGIGPAVVLAVRAHMVMGGGMLHGYLLHRPVDATGILGS